MKWFLIGFLAAKLIKIEVVPDKPKPPRYVVPENRIPSSIPVRRESRWD
jgi:hypothetical protein